MMAASAIGDGTGGFSIEEVELADPGADEVLVEVRGHDWRYWEEHIVDSLRFFQRLLHQTGP